MSRGALPGFGRVGAILTATALAFAVGAVVAPSSLSSASIWGMLPLVAVLSIVALGQHLVIQQRGLDLSVAGAVSVAAVIVTAMPDRAAGAGDVVLWSAMAIGGACAIGLLNGVLVVLLNVPALIATIGVNSLFTGVAIWLAGGVPRQGPRPLVALGRAEVLSLPVIPILALIIVAVTALAMSRMVIGRNLTAVAVNPATARLLGLPVRSLRLAAYATAGAFYGIAGVLLAAHLATPSVLSGLPYVLASVAAVVVAGNSVAGGAPASVVATAIGALFLTYLGQLVLSVGMPVSAQAITQAAIVLISAVIAARAGGRG
ncbi:ABC transporter permease [Pseudooceanicola sp. C21-150M6]|uniref:ABC transporter permease n=1 Tax=Pseudooceanicola sp. C21-150M6 TaxID=3434355 RepID=UPI003D7F4548